MYFFIKLVVPLGGPEHNYGAFLTRYKELTGADAPTQPLQNPAKGTFMFQGSEGLTYDIVNQLLSEFPNNLLIMETGGANWLPS